MRIVLVHNYYQQPGGEDVVFSAEGQLLAKYGHQVTRYTASNNDVSSYSPVALAGVTLWNGTQYRKMRVLLRTEHPDIVHVHNTFPLISPSIYYAANAENVPLVQTLHNYRPFCLNGVLYRDGRICEDCLGRYPVPGILHRCYRGSLTASAAVTALYIVHHKMLRTYQDLVSISITSSQFVKNLYLRMGLSAEKIVVKPNLVNVSAMSKTQLSAELKSKKIVFVGRLDERKGIWTLLSAIEKTKLPLVLIGDGDLRRKVEAWVHQRPDINVEITGWLDSAGISERFEAASMLILPSEFYESFGNVIVEAFSYGIPVITTNIGAQSELVKTGENGFLFPVGDSNALATIITRLEDDLDLRQSLAKNARLEYEQKYAPERNYEMLLNIYAQAIELKKQQQ